MISFMDKITAKITEVDYATIIDYVQKEVLSHNGRGFTIQICPEITKHEIYRSYTPLFGKAKHAYKFDLWGDTNGFTSIGYLICTGYPSEWKAVISQSIEKTGDTLPNGVAIEKEPRTILLDERETGRSKEGSRVAGGYHYLEGRRVYISVSDEYAARIFKEVYTETGFPFRDLLLTKHEHILQEIASKIPNPEYHGKVFFVDNDCVGIGEGYRYDADFPHVTGRNKCYVDAIFFEKLGMKSLESIGQKYGMALATIETIKNNYPELRNAIFSLKYTENTIQVDYKKIPPKPVTKPQPNLNDW